MTQTQITQTQIDAVVHAYVAQVTANGTVTDVLAVINLPHGLDKFDVIYEMLDASWHLGFRTTGDCQDDWWDALTDALPAVAQALQ